jgi:hypothetical protein
MKIIKHGSKDYNNPEYLLRCETCGCEFVVRRSEMAVAGSQYNERIFLYPCPECKSRCYIGEENRRMLH